MVRLDLRLLETMHPCLAATTCAEFAYRAGIALQRREHAPGAGLIVTFSDDVSGSSAVLDWQPVNSDGSLQLDAHRVTEDGAEAVALALVSVSMGWVVLRRLQRGEFADWLLKDQADRRVALEISGIDGVLEASRLEEKLRQVCRAAAVIPVQSVCVVAFGPPAVALRTV